MVKVSSAVRAFSHLPSCGNCSNAKERQRMAGAKRATSNATKRHGSGVCAGGGGELNENAGRREVCCYLSTMKWASARLVSKCVVGVGKEGRGRGRQKGNAMATYNRYREKGGARHGVRTRRRVNRDGEYIQHNVRKAEVQTKPVPTRHCHTGW